VWLPFVSDRDLTADLLAAADLYVAPGPAETFGLSALEAMAAGIPVLSVDRGGVADRIRVSGAGALYPTGDSHALAEAAIRLLQGDLRSLGLTARRTRKSITPGRPPSGGSLRCIGRCSARTFKISDFRLKIEK
jgi:Glycosyltransferase